jgi:hypothetical protein
VQRLLVVDAPPADRIDVRGVGAHAGVDGRPARVAVAPGRVGRADVVGRAVDRVQVHRRLHRGQLGAELGVELHRLVGDLRDEVGAPVPLVALRVQLVEGALQGRVRHRRGAVQQRFRQRVQHRRHRVRRVLLGTGPAPDDTAHLAHVELLRERRCGRHRGEREEAVQVARGAGEEVAVDREDLGGGLHRPERRPGDHGVHLVHPEQERGDDAEVAAAAADRPVQVGVLVGARAHAVAARQHQLGLEQVVDREAVPPCEVTQAAAQGEASDAGRGDDPARRGEAVLVRRLVDLAPRAAAADADGPGLRIDVDVLERGEIDDDTVVNSAEPGSVVAASADGEGQVAVAGERDGPRDVARAGAARDQGGPLVDHRVVDRAVLVVGRVLRADQLSLERAAEFTPGRLRGRGNRAHPVSFGSRALPSLLLIRGQARGPARRLLCAGSQCARASNSSSGPGISYPAASSEPAPLQPQISSTSSPEVLSKPCQLPRGV